MAKILDEYVKYLIVSPLNQTQTYMGAHHMGLSHDQVNRYMRGERLRPRHLWQAVRGDVVPSAEGYLLFDDTVINKEHSEKIEMAQVQYSGNAHGLVLGISVVNCVYYNPETKQFWVIDYRIYDPKTDGRNKLQHMEDMLRHTVDWKKLPFRGVLMDTWYATNHLMQVINSLGKYFYCPIKENRSVHQGVHWTQPKHLQWDAEALKTGHAVRLKKLEKGVNVRLHRQATVRYRWCRVYLSRHQRHPFAIRDRHSSCRTSLEGGGTAPRNQAAHSAGTVPMPQSPRPAEPYRLRKPRLGHPQTRRLCPPNHRLST